MSKLAFETAAVVDIVQARRSAVIVVVYTAINGAGFYLAYDIRFDFVVPGLYQAERLRLLPFVVGIKLVALVCARQLGSLMAYFSVPDLLRLFWAMAASSAVLLLPHLFGIMEYAAPRGVLLTDFMLCFGGLSLGRLAMRLYRERLSGIRRAGNGGQSPQQRIAIVGAGGAGASLAKEFLNTPSRGFCPVMFFDDDPAKHGKLVHGVPVIGGPEVVSELKEAGALEKAIIAMPSTAGKRIREIVALFARQGLRVEILPGFEDLASGRMHASRIRPIEVEDLLGRETVNLDLARIRKLIEGKVVLITGAGGSIGSELCRQVAGLNPQRLLMVEQSEGALFIIEQEMNEIGCGALTIPLVADVLDSERIEYIFSRYNPDVVFHAAAHKHAFMMERQPAEAIRNNVIGTRQIAQIAVAYGVSVFVFISTHKAVNPTSVVDATKRLAELEIMAIATSQKRTKVISVRLGNVLGSSGSVVPIIKRQIASGGPVTVTHPDVTRYFISVTDAIGVVLQASVLGAGSEIFAVDMGRPVRIADLARQMIELSGLRVTEDIELKFTGLKPGEKLHEELPHHSEDYAATEHPRISRFIGSSNRQILSRTAIEALQTGLNEMEENEIKRQLQSLVPEYVPILD